MKNISAKQLQANRRNAARSTGPRTAKGKSTSRLNARKHGLLARQVVACGYFYQESSDEFKNLCHEYQQNLTSQIVTLIWRLRRVRIAESGEIAIHVDRRWWNPRKTPWELGNGFKGNALHYDLHDYWSTVDGVEFVIECLQNLRATVEKDGELTDATLKELRAYPQPRNEITAQLVKLRQSFESNSEHLSPEDLRARYLQDVITCLDRRLTEYKYRANKVQKRMDTEDSIRRAAALLPPDEILEKIVRYEATLHRQLYRAINQLERLQRRRLGENVPAPIVMDVSMRG
jgi:hypothetical protein